MAQNTGGAAPISVRKPYVYLRVGALTYAYDYRRPPLGAGNMGTVHDGWCVETGERVAIKQVSQQYQDIPVIRERARLEGSMRFAHPNLVDMRGSAMSDPLRGPVFIVSGFVTGVTLERYVDAAFRRSAGAEAKICRMMEDVLAALDYLHGNGILHLDVKPSNIMVEADGNVRLMDLGIAYTGGHATLSSPGLLGTPEYAAPEQESRGESTAMDPRTDIYEAGVTLYELLTGTNPYRCESVAETMSRHKSLELPALASVSAPVLQTLRQATAPYPDARYQTAAEMAAALRRALLPRKTWWQRWLGM